MMFRFLFFLLLLLPVCLAQQDLPYGFDYEPVELSMDTRIGLAEYKLQRLEQDIAKANQRLDGLLSNINKVTSIEAKVGSNHETIKILQSQILEALQAAKTLEWLKPLFIGLLTLGGGAGVVGGIVGNTQKKEGGKKLDNVISSEHDLYARR